MAHLDGLSGVFLKLVKVQRPQSESGFVLRASCSAASLRGHFLLHWIVKPVTLDEPLADDYPVPGSGSAALEKMAVLMSS